MGASHAARAPFRPSSSCQTEMNKLLFLALPLLCTLPVILAEPTWIENNLVQEYEVARVTGLVQHHSSQQQQHRLKAPHHAGKARAHRRFAKLCKKYGLHSCHKRHAKLAKKHTTLAKKHAKKAKKVQTSPAVRMQQDTASAGWGWFSRRASPKPTSTSKGRAGRKRAVTNEKCTRVRDTRMWNRLTPDGRRQKHVHKRKWKRHKKWFVCDGTKWACKTCECCVNLKGKGCTEATRAGRRSIGGPKMSCTVITGCTSGC